VDTECLGVDRGKLKTSQLLIIIIIIIINIIVAFLSDMYGRYKTKILKTYKHKGTF